MAAGLTYIGRMFEDEKPVRPASPKERLDTKLEPIRIHSELAAVFEAVRKFGVRIVPGLDMEVVRDVQQTTARLEKTKTPGKPFLEPTPRLGAISLFEYLAGSGLSTGDYHIHRRPGETMIVRRIVGEEVDTFYQRMQAHLDVALKQAQAEEKQAHEWKADPATTEYLNLLAEFKLKMDERWYRQHIKVLDAFCLRTQTADDLNIRYLAEIIMGVGIADVVGAASVPTSEADVSWFFKLFSLCGQVAGTEQIVFFAFLQRTNDSFELDDE